MAKKQITTDRPSLERDLSAYKPEALQKLLKDSKGSKIKIADKLNPTVFEPKVDNRWLCIIEDDAGKELIPSYLIRSFSRPDLAIETVVNPVKPKEVSNGPFLTRNIGKLTKTEVCTGQIQLQSYDPIVPSASKLFTELLKSKKTFTIRLEILDPVGGLIEEWVYYGCKIETLSFSRLDWGSKNDPSMVNAYISVLSSKLH